MATPDDLLQAWHGKIVPQSFNAGFVTLSYVVSLIGAASTLELINRRTAIKGIFNHLLLVGAAVTMGGIAIWCMHYIGNRAINIAEGQATLQIAYSGGFTALSFFVPILVLLAAFVATGTNNKVQWWRVTVGGALAGAAICGMHYLGNASISNYSCEYKVANVVGAAIISVTASIVALSLFFVFRAAWTTSWWKRGLCAIVLAGAVSGMHWCASTGTKYRLRALNTGNSDLSRTATVIVVITLSVGACLVIAVIAITTNQVMKRSAKRAQQVVLAVAVFDKQGRLLVSPDGLLPSEQITETFMGRSAQEPFTVQHPLFQWMFRASRNWSSIDPIVDGMRNHLAHLPHKKGGDDARRGGVQLISDHGELIQDYETVLCELFCTAAQALAFKLKAPLASAGVLWDEILATGNSSSAARRQRAAVESKEADYESSEMAERGAVRAPEYGRGSLMFLVRSVESARELGDLEAAGYRFAELRHVSGIIGSGMQIRAWDIEAKLRAMQTYACDSPMLEPGVHVGFFGVRARVNDVGFDVLVNRGARNLLPSVQMPFDTLEPWQLAFLRQVDRMNPDRVVRHLAGLKTLSPKESFFASQLVESIHALRRRLADPRIFDEAILSAKVVEVPCRRNSDGSGPGMATMIALCVVVPIHQNISSETCEVVPLSFFKVHQLVDRDSPHHLHFLRSVHREIYPIINAVPNEPPKSSSSSSPRHGSRLQGFYRERRGRAAPVRVYGDLGDDGRASPPRGTSPQGSTKASSTNELWPGARASTELGTQRSSADLRSAMMMADDEPNPLATPLPMSSFGGIMVSQEITVDVHATASKPGPSRDGEEQQQQQQQSPPLPPQNHRREPSQGGDNLQEADSDPEAKPAPTVGVAPIKIIRSRREEVAQEHNLGVSVVVSKAEAGAEGESMTFVDELFGVCLGQR